MKRVSMQDVRKTDYYYEEAIKTLLTNIKFAGKDVKTILLAVTLTKGKAILHFLWQEKWQRQEKGFFSWIQI